MITLQKKMRLELSMSLLMNLISQVWDLKTIPAITGRPAYHPATMLKLYVYGYLNRVQSTRRLEREAGRNVELMWLLGRLVPDFKPLQILEKTTPKPYV